MTGQSGRSWSADFRPSILVSEADYVPKPYGIQRNSVAAKLIAPVQAFLYGLRHARRFDVLHLYFGQTMLVTGRQLPFWGQMDLPLWKALGKKVFMTFQGCDARIRGVCLDESISACAPGVCQIGRCNEAADLKRNRVINMISRYCDKLFCLNPDLLQFVPRSEYLPYACLDPSLLRPREKIRNPTPIVVHAPSDRAIKGTHLVEEASLQLQKSHPHEFLLVENLPRSQALAVYAGADIIVDQLFTGWYGGVAVEAMALGLPVVAYLNEKYLSGIPAGMRSEIPIVSATPGTLTEVLARLLENPQDRHQLGERGREFVQRWHHPVKIARRMLDLYRDASLNFWENYRPDRGED